MKYLYRIEAIGQAIKSYYGYKELGNVPIGLVLVIDDVFKTLQRSFIDAQIEQIERICNESEWECPEHGKEFVITLPLCRECNQCLEINLPIARLTRSLITHLEELKKTLV